jgi:glycerol-3-phosphate dehydrogenase
MGDWTGALAEGVFASKAIPVLKQKYGINLNVFDEIYRIIHEKKYISDFALCCTNYTLSRINMNANTDTNSKNM